MGFIIQHTWVRAFWYGEECFVHLEKLKRKYQRNLKQWCCMRPFIWSSYEKNSLRQLIITLSFILCLSVRPDVILEMVDYTDFLKSSRYRTRSRRWNKTVAPVNLRAVKHFSRNIEITMNIKPEENHGEKKCFHLHCRFKRWRFLTFGTNNEKANKYLHLLH